MTTGSLTLEQLDLLLTHLPVDVSFVDENNIVRYYSSTKDRIFTRSPAVIGRKVQNCHPVKSVHNVDAILNAFRAGDKDDAEFWIEIQGKFIRIRYFAVRDTTGSIRGVSRVSSHHGIRALKARKDFWIGNKRKEDSLWPEESR